jgi:hypothetical protein
MKALPQKKGEGQGAKCYYMPYLATRSVFYTEAAIFSGLGTRLVCCWQQPVALTICILKHQGASGMQA